MADLTCQAPRTKNSREDDLCGIAHAAQFGPCPTYGVACWRHHDSEEAKAYRKDKSSRGGRKAHKREPMPDSPVGKGTGGLEPDDVTLDPIEALVALGTLDDQRRDALHQVLLLGDLEHAARRLNVEADQVKRWVDEDQDFRMALELMRPYGPDRLKDFVTIGASICAKRLVVLAHKTEDPEQLVRVSRVIFKQLQQVETGEVQRQMADLRETIEALREEQQEDIGA